MLLPVAGIDVNPLAPPLAALVASFFCSMGGLSGAFLLLPFQMSFLGYTSPSVSATNQFYNVVAIPSGVYRYVREGRMVWPLVWIVVAGTLPGVFLGAVIRVRWLPDPRHFKLFAGLVLLYIGGRMIRDLLRNKGQKNSAEERFHVKIKERPAKGGLTPAAPLPSVIVREFSLARIAYDFQGESFSCSSPGIFGLSFVIGIVGGIYGIGGGAILAPFLVSFFGLPIYTLAGATLMGTFTTSVAGVIFYLALAPFYPEQSVAPDWILGLLLGLGGMAGMYLGARCQKFVPARVIKWMLVLVIIGTGIKYATEFF